MVAIVFLHLILMIVIEFLAGVLQLLLTSEHKTYYRRLKTKHRTRTTKCDRKIRSTDYIISHNSHRSFPIMGHCVRKCNYKLNIKDYSDMF